MKDNPIKSKAQNLDRVLIAILIILVVGGGALVAHDKFGKGTHKYEKGFFNFDYSQLDSFSLKGNHAGTGITFSKPIKYKLVTQNDEHTQASFSHSEKTPKSFDFLGALHVGNSYNAAADPKTFRDFYKQTLADPQSAQYKNVNNNMKDFVINHFSPIYSVSFSDIKDFHSSNIGDAAWSMDITASPKQKQPLGSPMENYSGKVIFAVGKQTSYFFYIYNTSYNWDNNRSIFERTFQSIKIDQ